MQNYSKKEEKMCLKHFETLTKQYSWLKIDIFKNTDHFNCASYLLGDRGGTIAIILLYTSEFINSMFILTVVPDWTQQF